MNIINDIQNAFLPDLIILIFIIINVTCSFFVKEITQRQLKAINIGAVLLTLLSIFFIQINPTYYAFNSSYSSNLYTISFKIMILIAILFILISSHTLKKETAKKSFLYFATLFTGIFSSFALVSSNDFITAFLSFEILSASSYFLIAFKKNHQNKEIIWKYLIPEISTSVIFLLGVSYLYGVCGSLNFSIINETLSTGDTNILIAFSCILIISSILFKIGCMPFNNWLINIYERTNFNIGAYFSLIPNIAKIGFLAKLFVFIFSYIPLLDLITAIISISAILYASICALPETNIKRLYGYFSVIQMGFILLALSAVSVYSLSTAIFYIFTYIFMNMGIWTASIIYAVNYQTTEINDYKGLFYKNPYFTIAFIICLISFAGLPPTSGFISKLYIYSTLLRVDYFYLLILFVALFATIICFYVYFKIIKVFFDTKENNNVVAKKIFSSKFILYFCSFILIVMGLFPNKIIKLAEIIAYYI